MPSEDYNARKPAPRRKSALRYFGNYVLLGEIARGGMGVVYRALQANLDREVAIKMIDAGALASEDAVRRFHTEAEAMAKLDHPNIVAIYEIGEHDGQHYFAMKLVDGPSLADRVGTSPLEMNAAVELLIKVAVAVQYAHDRGVLHRDLKPSNILLDERGEPHVTDFGIAKLVQREANFTGSLATMGTPEYMAPEQALGKMRHVGTAADIYSLGAVFYHLLTGQPPFTGETPFVILDRVIKEEPAAPSRRNSKVIPPLDAICLRCLEKDPGRRYQTARALADDLRNFQASETGKEQKSLPMSRTSRPVMLAAAVIAALLLAFAMMWMISNHRRVLQQTQSETSALVTAISPQEPSNAPVSSSVVSTPRSTNDELEALGFVRERREKSAEGDRIQYFNVTGRLLKQVLFASDGSRQTNLYEFPERLKRQETFRPNGRREIVSVTYDRNGKEFRREVEAKDERGPAMKRVTVACPWPDGPTITNDFVRGSLGWVFRPQESRDSASHRALFGSEWMDSSGVAAVRPFRYRWNWPEQEWYGNFRNTFMPEEIYPSVAHWLTDWLVASYLMDSHATGPNAAQLRKEANLALEEAESARRITVRSRDVKEVRDAKATQTRARERAETLLQSAAATEARALSFKAQVQPAGDTLFSPALKTQMRTQIEKIIALAPSGAEQSLQKQRSFVSQALADPLHVFIVSRNISVVSAQGSAPAGNLNEGNVLRLDSSARSPLSKANGYTPVPANVLISGPGNVPAGTSILIPLIDLQEFESEFHARLAAGMVEAEKARAAFRRGMVPGPVSRD